MAVLALHCCMGFSLVAEDRLWASGLAAVAALGAPQHVGSSRTSDRTCVSCFLYPWATQDDFWGPICLWNSASVSSVVKCPPPRIVSLCPLSRALSTASSRVWAAVFCIECGVAERWAVWRGVGRGWHSGASAFRGCPGELGSPSAHNTPRGTSLLAPQCCPLSGAHPPEAR